MTMFLSIMTGTMAQDTSQRLVVWQKNGQKVYFDLAEEPETTFGDGLLVISTSKTTVYYHLENVLRYTYEGDIMDVVSTPLQPGEIRFKQGKDQMAFEGLPENTIIEVYTLDGKLLQTQKVRKAQQSIVSLTNRPAGTYIVKVGDVTYKFQKR